MNDLLAPEEPAPNRPKRPTADLTGRQKKFLRGEAHHLSALVRVGRGGLTESLATAIDEALDSHELIKVKLLEAAPIGKKELAEAVALRCGAHVAGIVGRVVILYRRHKNKPQVRLPSR